MDDDDTISDRDGDNRRPLDGDADGTPGGVYNFWFQTRPLDRVLRVTGDGNTFVDGQMVTIEDAFGNVRRFEFDSNGPAQSVGERERARHFHRDRSHDRHRHGQPACTTRCKFSSVSGRYLGRHDALPRRREPRHACRSDSAASGTSCSARLVGVELEGKTIFVDKTSGTNSAARWESRLTIFPTAFARLRVGPPGDIVRIVGNGGFDGDRRHA